MPVPQPYTRADAEEFLARQLSQDSNQRVSWAIEYTGSAVGGINVGLDMENRVGTIGYSIARRLWGRGLTTEAAGAVIRPCVCRISRFESYPGVGRRAERRFPARHGKARYDPRRPPAPGSIRAGRIQKHGVVRTVAVRMGDKRIPDVNRVYHRVERVPDTRPEPFPELAVPIACRRVEGPARGAVMGSNARAFRHFDKLNAGMLNDRAWM